MPNTSNPEHSPKTLHAYDVTVEIHPNGSTIVRSNGPVDVIRYALTVGSRMPDGTVYAGISPDFNKPLFVLPSDAPLNMTWQQAASYAAGLEGADHAKATFRLPTDRELGLIFRNKAAIGGFHETNDMTPDAVYWSSDYAASDSDSLRVHHFGEGQIFTAEKTEQHRVRLVRLGTTTPMKPTGPP